jgi:hypothetical protein
VVAVVRAELLALLVKAAPLCGTAGAPATGLCAWGARPAAMASELSAPPGLPHLQRYEWQGPDASA